MVSTTIRVSDGTKARLGHLSKILGKRQKDVLEEAIENFERDTFFERLNRRFDELRSDPQMWAGIEAEREVEEGSLSDESA